ncbi:hypothetical protein AC251_00080 [Ralstonia pseudosolanacearum]|nr:hypothetical protein AC251_00080 [Ralstonia pseudosolanacearum]OAI65242.1 hypothetical protein RSP781_16605 [Ralstonia pseudosolanacearum]
MTGASAFIGRLLSDGLVLITFIYLARGKPCVLSWLNWTNGPPRSKKIWFAIGQVGAALPRLRRNSRSFTDGIRAMGINKGERFMRGDIYIDYR